MREIFDMMSGFTLCHNDRPILRLFFDYFDNAKNFFDLVFLDIDVDNNKIEKLLFEDIWIKSESNYVLHDEYFFINHLTHSKMPGNVCITSGGWPIYDNLTQVLYIWGRPKKPIWERARNFLRSLPVSLCSFFARLISKAGFQVLQDNEKANLNHDFMVLDLRRGTGWDWDRYAYSKEIKPMKYFFSSYYDCRVYDYYRRCSLPVTLNDIKECKSFALALPCESHSQYYQMLRSNVDPLRVVELTLFMPDSLEDYLEYQNIKQLFLLYADENMSFSHIKDYTKLETVFISGSAGLLTNASLNSLKGIIDITIAIATRTPRDKTQFIRWCKQ